MERKKKSPLTVAGAVLLVLGVILAMAHIDGGENGAAAFLAAAAPYVIVGAGVAMVLAGSQGTGKK